MPRTAVATMVKVPTDRVELELDGQTFGIDGPPKAVSSVEVPETLASLADILRTESRLLKLHCNADLTKNQVLEAYGHDVKLLDERMKDLDACVLQAVRCLIVVGGDRQLDPAKREERARQVWEQQVHQLSVSKPLQHELRLPFTLAGEDAVTILGELQQQFQRSLASALHRLAAQLKSLVDHDFIGLVSWAGMDACCYHYFVVEHREYLDGTRIDTTKADLGGGITEVRKTRHTDVTRVQYRARHTHHLVNAKLQNIGQYHHKMPSRIEQFLQSLPPRVRHLFRIVDGQETLNEVTARKIGERTDVESETIAVYRYDPAVTLGDFALVGWDEQEVQTERVQIRADRWKLINLYGGPCLALLMTISLIVGITYRLHTWIADYNRKNQEVYATYMATMPTGQVIVTKRGEVLQLGQHLKFVFDELRGNSVDLKPSKGKFVGFTLLLCPERSDAYYGTINLEDSFGISLKLHVKEATRDAITYVVSPSNSPEKWQK